MTEQSWPADKVERRPVSELIPYAMNSRTHTPEQVDQIAASIEEWGWTTPVLIQPDGTLIAGHARVMAAQQLQIEAVPCMVAEGWSEAQIKAYVIADNKLAEAAGWDNRALQIEFEALKGLDFDLQLTGFTIGELDEVMGLNLEGDTEPTGKGSGSLAERFGIAPFTIFNAREGWWQDRKRAWLALGIQSELGRGEGARACPGGQPMPSDRKDYVPGGKK